MIRTTIILFGLILILFLFPFNFIIDSDPNENRYSSVFDLSPADTVWVDSILSKMTLREKCAQLIFAYATSFDTTEDSDDYRRLEWLVKELKIGGIIFFQGEIKNQAVLTNKLQKISEIPLMIAADFERGLGMRLNDAVEFPHAMAFGATGDPYLSYLMGKITAIEGRALGVHQNYAPLLDVNHDYRNPIINIRAFSENPEIIAEHSIAFIRGMNEGNMLTTAKHFPGHGATDMDSHNELPTIYSSRAQLENNDLLPFKEAIKAGVKSIMTGHLSVPAYDEKDLPATFSKAIVTDLLQNKLGYDGLIITDAMNMKSIISNYSNEEAAKLAIQAGNDLIIFPQDEESAAVGIYDAVKSEELSEDRIENSVRKILRAKRWLGLNENKYINLGDLDNTLNKKSHWRLAEVVAEKSITLVKDDYSLIPVNPSNYYSTACIILSDVDSKKKEDDSYLFEDLVKENFNYLRTFKLTPGSKDRDYSKAVRIAKRSDLILLPIYINVRSFQGSVELNEKQLEFIKRLIERDKPLVIMSFGNPYILSEFSEAATYLCSYSESDASQKAMLNAIMGRVEIEGKLPVSIPNTTYALGYGLKRKSDILYKQKNAVDSNYNFLEIDSLMEYAVMDSIFPGGVLLIGHRGRVVYNKAFGKFSYDISARDMTIDAIFDIASLTKVVGTTSAVMLLVDEGKLDLEDRVTKHLPEFGNNGKDNITIRNLLLHNSGLPSFKPFYKKFNTADEVIDDIMGSKLEFTPGDKYLYSDLGMITLQKLIEKITGQKLDAYLSENLFKPLGMSRTLFNPPHELWYYCVPTETDNYWRMITLKGKVHDETAYLLNGVAGHAGLFSTSQDLAIFMQVLLNKGMYTDKKIFEASTVEYWTERQSNHSSRALGWDTKSEENSSAGNKFSEHSFGHTGFTGTSIWADKERGLFVILLTNRVHPSRENNKIIQFRPILHDAVVDAVSYF